MGAVSDLPVPQGGAIADLPVPNTSPSVTPEQADIQNFNATSGAAAKGFRSGMNSIGATMSNFIGASGEALGLTQFAKDRYQDAKRFSDFSEAVGPDVRDYGQVKDFNTLTQFVLGMGAQGAATSLPALGLAIGLRRPVVGIGVPTFMQEHGEQIGNLRDDPKVMASTTPQQRWLNAGAKGTVNAALEIAGGAEGQAARRLLNPAQAAKGFGKTMVKSTVGEGLTEGAQNVVGQKLHQQLNPEKPLDVHDIINDTLAGAAGGGAIGASAHIAGAAPSLVAKSADELKARLSKKEAPLDPEGIPDEAMKATSQEDVVEALRKFEEKVKTQYENVKDPVKQKELFEAAMQKYRDSEIKPVIDDAIKKTKPIFEGLKQYINEKRSEQRTQADDDILDNVTENMPQEFKDGASPEQLRGLGDLVRKIAENPQEFKNSSVPHTLQKVLGPKFKAMTDFAIDRVYSTDAQKAQAKAAVREAFAKKSEEDDFRINKAKDIIRSFAKPVYGVDKQMREAMLDKLAPQMLDHLHTGFKAEDLQSDKHKNDQFVKALYEAFGENSRKVMEALDELRLQEPTTSARAFEGGRGFDAKNLENLDAAQQGTTEKSIMADSPMSDPRLDRVYQSAEAAEKGAEALRAEYGPKDVRFRVESPAAGEEGYGTHTVVAEQADQEGLSPQELQRVREPETTGAFGLDKGIIIARTDEHRTGIKINIRRLTALMMQREGQQTQEGGAKYVADMFSRGMSAMMSTPGFRMFVATGKGVALTQDKQGRWVLPDNTPVGTLAGKTYTYGDIKVHKLTRMELKGITKEDIEMEQEQIKSDRADKEQELHDAQADGNIQEAADLVKELSKLNKLVSSPEALRDEAIKRAVDRSQRFAESQTSYEPHEQGQDEGMVTMAQKEGDSPSRDVHERRQYDEDPKSPNRRVSEEHTRAPVGGVLPAAAEQLPKGRPGGGEVDINAQTPATRANQAKSEEQVRTRLQEAEYRKQNAEKFSLMENKSPEQSLENFQKYMDEKHPLIETRMEHYGDSLYLQLIMARKDSDQGKGHGTAAMNDIVSYADKVNKGLFLRAYPKDSDKMPLAKLEKWYEKFGLVAFDMDQREYPGQSTEMYREAQGDINDGEEKAVEGSDRTGKEGSRSSSDGQTTEAVSEKGPNSKEGMMALAVMKGAIQFSTMNVGKGPISEETQQEVRDYVEKVLGKKAKVVFEKMAAAGSFAKLGDAEVLKIAVDAIDPMSVGYHESLHAFFSRLTKADPKAAHTLLRAASSAPIVARLRELLADHPAALKQLSDPEERLAYMYQFSAKGEKGLLHIGPETRTWFEKVKGFFRKIGAIWSDEMASAMAVERANELLDAFHNGEFANRNTVAQVLHDKFPPDAREKADRVFPQLGRFMDKFVWTASGAVRDMNIPALTNIIDKFHTDTEGGKEPGMLQTKHTVFNRFMNPINAALKGLNEAQIKEVWDEMHTDVRKSDAAKKLEEALKAGHKYLVESGVKIPVWNNETKEYKYKDIGNVKNYFPRVPDNEYLRTDEGKKAFFELMKKYKLNGPEQIYAKMSEDFSMGNPREDQVLGLTYYTPATNERSLYMIPDEELAPFLNKDLYGTLSQYFGRAARRGEYARRFGNAGEEIQKAAEQAKALGMTPAQEKTFHEVVQAMEGTLGGNMSKELRAVYGAVTTYQNIRLLPLALFSNLVDPIGIVVRGGTVREGFGAFTRGIRELAKYKDDDAAQLAATVGAINTATETQVMGDMYSSQFMPTLQKRINDKFFRWIGMESWNRSQRIAATAAAEQFIIRHAEKPMKDSERYLRELGLTKDDVKVENGKLDLTDQKVVDAVNLWTDQAIIRPNAALRPVYMSDPNWILISHLKQYSYMFQKVIVARVMHELQHGNYSPAYALSSYVPLIIASDMLRVGLTPGKGDDHPDWTALDWLERGVQRAGLFGPGQFVLDAGTDYSYGKNLPTTLLGPTGQQLGDFLSASLSGRGLGREAVRAIPLVNKLQ